MKTYKKHIKARVLTFAKKHREASVSPTEATKNLFSDIWKVHVDEVRSMAGELQSEQLVGLSSGKKELTLPKPQKHVRLTTIQNKD